MLKLARRPGETLMIGDVCVEVLSCFDGAGRVSFRQPGVDYERIELMTDGDTITVRAEGQACIIRAASCAPGRINFAIDAPRSVQIDRGETLERIAASGAEYVCRSTDSYVSGRGASR